MVKFGDVVVYNGGEGKAHELALITNVWSDELLNLAVIDGDGNWTIKTSVPRRSPADYEAGGGGGHTWYYRD